MNQELLDRLSAVTPEEQILLAGGALDKGIYSGKAGFVVDSGRMLEKGRLIAIRAHTRFVSFPSHRHNYVEITYVCRGKTVHRINGGAPLTLRQGELLLLSQHVEHAIDRAELADVAVNIMVLPQFFDYALELIGPDNVLGQFVISCLQSRDTAMGYLHFQVAEVLPIQNLMENLIWSLQSKQRNYRQLSQVTMGLLFLQLLNHTHLLDFAQTDSAHVLVTEALREIEENYQNASLSQLAQRRGVSVAYVSRLVRSATGKTFKEMLQEKRLTKAAVLLRTTGLTVGEIIAALGYDNTSYFYRIFRKKYGIVPKEYRKTLQVK